MLVRLLRTFPALPEAPQIRLALRGNLKAENIAQEVAYLSQKERQSFERTYGWAWLLKLAQELRGWDDPDGREWSKNLQPLADAIVDRFKSFLPRQTYPIRTGVHPNTAFALAFAFDYARSCGDKGLEELVVRRSKEYYLSDTLYPAVWEPGGEDFFSPALMEADLMARVLGPAEFHRWFHRFLPEISKKGAPRLLSPATVSDRHDPKIVHLDGLNLSRAWCMAHIASVLPKNDPVRPLLIKAAAALDGGPCAVGLESTVVSVLDGEVRLLRPGAVTRVQLQQIVGRLAEAEDDAKRSPGRLALHYAPDAPVRINAKAPEAGEAYLAFGPWPESARVFNLSPTGDLAEAAANLFAFLRAADRIRPSAIAVAPIPEEGLGEAINDRLRRAAGYVG